MVIFVIEEDMFKKNLKKNLLDEIYISDAQNNDPYNAIYQDFDAKSAGVFIGYGRRYSLSARFTF